MKLSGDDMVDISCDIDEKSLPNYKLFWVDEKQDKHVVEKFKAANDGEAYARRNEYASMHNDHEYYYGKVYYAKCITSSGKMVVRELCADSSSIIGTEGCSFLAKVASCIGDFFSYWLWQKPIDWWYKIKDIAYLLKHGERRSNQWNLDMHLISTLELNLPSLIKNSHSLMFLDEAIAKLHGNEVGFDLKKYHEKHCRNYPHDVEKLALEIQHDEYSKLLLNTKLYRYYIDAGIIDTSNPDDVEFDKEWRHTLPVKPGTYDEFDYTKLYEMNQELWNSIWDWIKEHGHTLYD